MEKTIITYRGRKLFTLGHTGTFVNYIFIFIFGCGWLSLGIFESINGDLIMAIIGCILGVGIILASSWAMYVNRTDKFLRDQKVITIKPTPFVPINTILIVKANMGQSPISTENNYLCQMVDNNRRVMVPEDTITDYVNWNNNKL